MAKIIDYQALNQELEMILVKLNQPDLDIDEAVTAYQRGKEITTQLQTYLKQAEHTVQKVKRQAQ